MIKVEHPIRGDDTRAWGPPFAKYNQGDDARHVGPPFAKNIKDSAKGNLKGPGESAYFIAVSGFDLFNRGCYADSTEVNRNKKSIGLSFQHQEGVKILHELAKTSDVLVENYIPGSNSLLTSLTACTPCAQIEPALTRTLGALKKYQLDYESMRKINPS